MDSHWKDEYMRTNKPVCPGSGLAAQNIRNNPDTVSPIGDCPRCKMSYSVKQDNGVYKHTVNGLPAAPAPVFIDSPVPEICNPAKTAEAIKILQGRVDYLGERVEKAVRELKRVDKPWWKRW